MTFLLFASFSLSWIISFPCLLFSSLVPFASLVLHIQCNFIFLVFGTKNPLYNKVCIHLQLHALLKFLYKCLCLVSNNNLYNLKWIVAWPSFQIIWNAFIWKLKNHYTALSDDFYLCGVNMNSEKTKYFVSRHRFIQITIYLNLKTCWQREEIAYIFIYMYGSLIIHVSPIVR